VASGVAGRLEGAPGGRSSQVIDLIQLRDHPADRSASSRAGMRVAMNRCMENMSNFQLWIARGWIRRDVKKIARRLSKRELLN
jgi:hypothetical protein